MLMRRDITVDDYSDVMADKYGFKATARFGLEVLRGNVVAKMTSIKTTL